MYDGPSKAVGRRPSNVNSDNINDTEQVAVPHRVATNETWVAFTDMLARGLLRGVRTRGTTPGGTEFYAATDRHRVTAIDGSWNTTGLGDLRDVDPPVRFGFSSTPRHPSIVEVTTLVHRTRG